MSLEPDVEKLLERADQALMSWDIALAGRLLERCEPTGDLRAEWLYYRAVVAELNRRQPLADDLYAAAAQLAPLEFRRPLRLEIGAARRMLAELIESLPEDVGGALANLRIDLLEVPELSIDGDPSTDPLVLGLYDGVPVDQQVATDEVVAPPRVRLFLRNIERSVDSADELREQLRITLFHEIGHHLGWDEDEVEQRGLG